MNGLFILEHPTRGCIDEIPGDRDDRYHFRTTGSRLDARRFRFAEAKRHLANCPKGTAIREFDPGGWRGWREVGFDPAAVTYVRCSSD